MSKQWVATYDYLNDFDPSRKSRVENKERVLAFMKSVEPTAAAGGRFCDMTSDKEIDVDWLSYSSGNFSWTTADIYHFEKYDLELKPEFIEYALSRSSHEA